MKNFIRVILESPFAHENMFQRNISYTRACARDCLLKGEAPFASHLLYTQEGILDDLNPNERALGIEAGLNWGQAAEKTVVYVDLGMSTGMLQGLDRAKKENRPIEERRLPNFNEWLEIYKSQLQKITNMSSPLSQFIK